MGSWPCLWNRPQRIWRGKTEPTEGGICERTPIQLGVEGIPKGNGSPSSDPSSLEATGQAHARDSLRSFAHGAVHARSDVDLAIHLNAANEEEELQIIDEILMSSERDVSVLKLDDEDESPFVAQQALRGIHLVEPDPETLHRVVHRVLHECEAIRFKRMSQRGSS